LSELLKRKKLFQNKDELIDNLLNYLDLNQKKIQSKNFSSVDYIDEKIIINPIDYYYSNVIARASKIMSECRSIKTDLKKTGTEG